MNQQNHPPKDDSYCKWSNERSRYLYPKFNNSEFFCDGNVSFNKLPGFEKYEDSHIFVLGAGPSAVGFDPEIVDYDYIWTCNHFYKNPVIKKIKFDMIGVGNEIDVKTYDLVDYFNKSGCYIGFELTSTARRYAELEYINEEMVKDYHDKLFWYQTKHYCGLGSGIEMVTLAIGMWPRKISFVGMDGIVGEEVPHNYEPGKTSYPSNYTEDLMYNRYKFFQNYMDQFDIEFDNLGYGNKYNLLTRIQNEQ